MSDHKTGTREEWLAARLELLEAEKQLTRRSDELACRRQQLRGRASTSNMSWCGRRICGFADGR